MADVSPISAESLRVTIADSVALVPSLEQAIVGAQERLRLELAKIEKLRELLALYEPNPTPDTTGQLSSGNNGPVVEEEEDEANDEDSEPYLTKHERMEQAVTALLEMRGTVHRSDLLAHLQDEGIMSGESDPLAHLAAFLSKLRDKFTSDGRGNFSLRS